MLETIATQIGLLPEELTTLITVALALLVALLALKLLIKLTQAMLRLGCLGVILIVAALYVLSYLD